MKTTTFAAFKAIAMVALFCMLGITESMAQGTNGPPAGSTYIIKNGTACTYLVDIDVLDGASCGICSSITGLVVPPGPTPVNIPLTCGPINSCDIQITIVSGGAGQCGGLTPVSVDYLSQTNSGFCATGGGCSFTITWGQTQTNIQ